MFGCHSLESVNVGIDTGFREAIQRNHVGHQSSIGSGGRSWIGGKISSSGFRVANVANNDVEAAGSMIARSLSLRISPKVPCY